MITAASVIIHASRLLIVLGFLFIAASAYANASTPLNVVATFSVLGDVAHIVGGDDVVVTTLIAPEVDLHAYDPSPRDAQKVAHAEVIFANGLGFEPWLAGLRTATKTAANVVEVSATVPIIHDRDKSEDHASHDTHTHQSMVVDPHVWQNVAHVRQWARTIVETFCAARPAECPKFQERARAYDTDLAALDTWIRQSWHAVPINQRRVVTTHDAFGYYGHAYGVTLRSLSGLSSHDDPTPASWGALIAEIKENAFPVIFLEDTLAPDRAERLAKETGAHLGGVLYAESLSPHGGEASTYLQMMRLNTLRMIEGVHAKPQELPHATH